tara:strand:+ start:5021 stop:5806 length:786 start_codon:yes stop_codon:yes gene_type:complete
LKIEVPKDDWYKDILGKKFGDWEFDGTADLSGSWSWTNEKKDIMLMATLFWEGTSCIPIQDSTEDKDFFDEIELTKDEIENMTPELYFNKMTEYLKNYGKPKIETEKEPIKEDLHLKFKAVITIDAFDEIGQYPEEEDMAQHLESFVLGLFDDEYGPTFENYFHFEIVERTGIELPKGIMKVWIECDRPMAGWQYKNGPVYEASKLRDKDTIIRELTDHDVAQGMFVLNYLLSQGGKVIGTHNATTGGVCTGVIALVDMGQ